MKNILFSIILLAFLFESKAQRDTTLSAPVNCASGEWNLDFEDDFSGEKLNSDYWVSWYPYTNNGSDRCVFCRTHGNEGQIFRDENVVVSEGTLKLVVRRETGEWMGETRPYSSAMIHSKQTFGMGKYEIRCRIPSGMGFWPAFWMFGNRATEIDVFEIGTQKPKYHHVAIHNWSSKISYQKGYAGLTNLSDGYHIYSMEWDSNFVTMAVDGNEVWRVSHYANKRGKVLRTCPLKAGKYRLQQAFPFADEKFSVIAGLGVGTSSTPFTKSPDNSTVFPNQMEIDWIRVYRRK